MVSDVPTLVPVPVQTPVSVQVPLGLSLKQQLERFKNKVALGDKSDVTSVQLPVRATDDDDEDEENDEDNEDNQDGKKKSGKITDSKIITATIVPMEEDVQEQKVYVPIPINEPVGSDGRVLKQILTEEELTELNQNNENEIGRAHV